MNTNQLHAKKLNSRQITNATRKWLKAKGYNDVQVHCTRGTFHVTNANNYMMTARCVLESATGMNFVPLNAYMAQPVYVNN